MPNTLNDAHEINNASAMEWQIDNPNGRTSCRQLPRPSSEESPSPTEDRSETPSSDGSFRWCCNSEIVFSFSPKNYVVNWTRSNEQVGSEAPQLPVLDQSASNDTVSQWKEMSVTPNKVNFEYCPRRR